MLYCSSGQIIELCPEFVEARNGSRIIHIHYSPQECNFLCIFASGAIGFLEGDGEFSFDVSGEFCEGISAALVSPDGELLIVVHSVVGVVHVMSRSSLYEIAEFTLEDAYKRVGPGPVSVGWGKKETQFHGSEGKQAAVTKITQKPQLDPFDEGEKSICWRSDSSFFLISWVCENGSRRNVQVFDRDGHSQSKIEYISGLAGVHDWSHEKALIASHRLNIRNQIEIVFHELNGLQHGSFVIPKIYSNTDGAGLESNYAGIKGIKWNCDGSLLSIDFVNGLTQIWSRTNYEWICKFTLKQGEFQKWHQTNPLELFQIYNKSLSLVWSINVSSNGLLAVIDGNNLKFTNFNEAIIPPPMCHFSLPIDCVAEDLYLSRSDCLENVYSVVVLGQDKIYSYSLDLTDQTITMVKNASVSQDDGAELLYNLFVTNSHVYFRNELQNIYHCKLINGAISEIEKPDLKEFGSISQEISVQKYAEICFDSSICSKYAMVETCFEGKKVIYCLRLIGVNLLINEELFKEDCCDFILTPAYLLIVNEKGSITFYCKKELFANGAENLNAIQPLESRLTENGAIFIAALPSTLILQMPRGNLEIIHPRPFIVPLICAHITSLEYLKAFVLARKHRIDLNILFDVQPLLFMATVSKFIADVQRVDYLNLFITSIKNEVNCLDSSFAYCKSEKMASPFDYSQKLHLISKAFIANLSPATHANTIITCWTVLGEYKSALKVILDHPSEDSLKYICFLVEAEGLFKVALEMYECSLALSIAKQSPQMDPSEYVPMLEGWHKCSDKSYKHFLIDDYLGLRERALKNLISSGVKGGKQKEAFDYALKHSLYRTFLSVKDKKDAGGEWIEMCNIYAQWNADNGKESLACDLFFLAGNMQAALKYAISSANFPKFKMINENHPCGGDDVSEMITSLIDKKDLFNAFDCAKTFSKNSEYIFNVAIDCQLYTQAIFYAQGKDILFCKAFDAVRNRQELVINELRATANSFTEYSDRLVVLQNQLVDLLDPSKITKAIQMANTEDVSDMMSEMSFRSVTSLTGTILSRSSAKSRKKLEKQKAKGKAGTPWERFYLRDKIEECLDKIYKTLPSIKEILQSTINIGYYKTNDPLLVDNELVGEINRIEKLVSAKCSNLRNLVWQQEEKLKPESIAALNISPWSIPETITVDHVWKASFSPKAEFVDFLQQNFPFVLE